MQSGDDGVTKQKLRLQHVEGIRPLHASAPRSTRYASSSSKQSQAMRCDAPHVPTHTDPHTQQAARESLSTGDVGRVQSTQATPQRGAAPSGREGHPRRLDSKHAVPGHAANPPSGEHRARAAPTPKRVRTQPRRGFTKWEVSYDFKSIRKPHPDTLVENEQLHPEVTVQATYSTNTFGCLDAWMSGRTVRDRPMGFCVPLAAATYSYILSRMLGCLEGSGLRDWHGGAVLLSILNAV